jgi:hypothetical protein
MGHIEWSPEIGIWLSQRWILHWVRLWMLGTGTHDPGNMFRSCYRMHVPDPRTSTYGAIYAQILVTEQEIQHLSKDAPALRHYDDSIYTTALPMQNKTMNQPVQRPCSICYSVRLKTMSGVV